MYTYVYMPEWAVILNLITCSFENTISVFKSHKLQLLFQKYVFKKSLKKDLLSMNLYRKIDCYKF